MWLVINRTNSSPTFSAFRAGNVLQRDPPPSLTFASNELPSFRAWSGVNVLDLPNTICRATTRLPPAPGRYSIDQDEMPEA